MSIGNLTRKILGKTAFQVVGKYYRAIFIDLEKVRATLHSIIPPNAHIIDIGGGDGQPVNLLLSGRKDLRVTMIDLSLSVGNALQEEFKDRVKILPGVSIKEYIAKHAELFDVIIVSDVIHHVPVHDRKEFYTDMFSLSKLASHPMVIIMEVDPRGFISGLGYISDRYISGDKNVNYMQGDYLQGQLQEVFGDLEFHNTDLYQHTPPNYMFWFRA